MRRFVLNGWSCEIFSLQLPEVDPYAQSWTAHGHRASIHSSRPTLRPSLPDLCTPSLLFVVMRIFKNRPEYSREGLWAIGMSLNGMEAAVVETG